MNLFSDIHLLDVIDILLVAVMIYGLLVVLRQTRMQFVAVGILIISSFYLVALTAGLQLTAFLFHVFFTVLVLALIVIFQEEVRIFFERFTAWLFTLRSGSLHVIPPEAEAVEAIISTLIDFSRQRIGALVVLQGESKLHRYTHGGTPLDGIISEQVLKSLFDPHSIGHDGALIIVGNRIERFGCHLRLSKATSQLKDRGTRHAAALGLAEETDALCLVVSEERGSISLAHRGMLTGIEGSGALHQVITQYFETKVPREHRHLLWALFTSNVLYKVASAFASIAMWFFFVHEAAIDYRSFNVPVHYTGLDPALTVGSVSPGLLRVIVSAPRRNFYLKSNTDFGVTLPLFGQLAGTTKINLTASEINMPDGITFEGTWPNEVELHIKPTQGAQS